MPWDSVDRNWLYLCIGLSGTAALLFPHVYLGLELNIVYQIFLRKRSSAHTGVQVRQVLPR